MASLSAQAVGKSYGGNDIFKDLSMDVAPGERLAITGPNGCGKSTLLRMLAGEVIPDYGRIIHQKDAGIGYSAQELVGVELETPLLTWVLGVFPSWGDFWQRWEEALAADDRDALKRLTAEQAKMESLLGWNPEHKAETILSGLGFSTEDFHRPLSEFSGGWRERGKLARVLLAGTDILLLDEPTNHLDLEAVEWLEQYILQYQGAVVIVVHDRVFLDTIATHVLYFGPGYTSFRRGNFTEFLEWQAENEKSRQRAAAKLTAKISHDMTYVNKFRVKARKASQAQSKLKKVEKLKTELQGLEAESKRKTLSFSLPPAARGDKVVAATEDMGFSYDGIQSMWGKLTMTLYRGQKVALTAPNGIGKSTLLKLLVGINQPTFGKVKLGPQIRIGYFSQHQTDILDVTGTTLSELRRLSNPDLLEEELRGTLGLFMLNEEYFDRKVSQLSGGEKSRLVLASLFLRQANFLVFDEPTNHLDMESREGLIEALRIYDGTVLMVAHDRHLIQEIAEEIWELVPDNGEGGIVRHLGGWDEFDRKRKEALKPVLRVDGENGIGKGHAARSKEEKRRQAEVRNRFSRELKPRKERYEKAESELEAVLERQTELEEIMADPDAYADQARFTELTKEYQMTKEFEETLFLQLSMLEEEIQRLESQREAELSMV